jgi:hypothetical protein
LTNLSILCILAHHMDRNSAVLLPQPCLQLERIMEYMLIFKEPAADFARRGDPAYWGAWGAYIGALQGSGVVKHGNGLQPPDMATSLRIRDGKREVQDGPYADTKEHLGGYFIVDVPSLDAAIEWAARSPSAQTGSVEIRPVMPPMNLTPA